MNPGPVRDNKQHRTNNKDCSKGEGLIVNEDLCEKEDYSSREREPEGLPEVTNSIGVFAAKERDQPDTESTVETKEQREVRREQRASVRKLGRQNSERREDRLRVLADPA